MINLVDSKEDRKVYFDEFLQMAKGETLSTIGLAYPPSIPLLERKNI